MMVRIGSWPRCLFECAENAHQHGLAISTMLAPIAVTVFAEDDGRANRSLRVVVVVGNSFLIQECEQVVLMSPKAFDQSSGICVFPRRLDHLGQTRIQTVAARSVCVRRQLVFRTPQTNCIPNQPTEFLGKRRPVFASRFVFFGVFQLAQQMHQTRLPRCACHRVVRSPKIGDQRPRKLLDKKLRQGRTAPRSVDDVEGQKLISKTPQPGGLSIGSPACFVAMKHRGLQSFFSNLFVPNKEDFLQSIPHLHQTALADLQLQMEVEDLDDLRQGIAQGVVQPRGKHQHAEAQRGTWQGADIGGSTFLRHRGHQSR